MEVMTWVDEVPPTKRQKPELEALSKEVIPEFEPEQVDRPNHPELLPLQPFEPKAVEACRQKEYLEPPERREKLKCALVELL